MSYRTFSISFSLVFLALTTSSVRLAAEVNKAQEVAPGVWFHGIRTPVHMVPTYLKI